MSADAVAGMERIFLSFSEFKTFLQLNSKEGGGPLKKLIEIALWNWEGNPLTQAGWLGGWVKIKIWYCCLCFVLPIEQMCMWSLINQNFVGNFPLYQMKIFPNFEIWKHSWNISFTASMKLPTWKFENCVMAKIPALGKRKNGCQTPRVSCKRRNFSHRKSIPFFKWAKMFFFLSLRTVKGGSNSVFLLPPVPHQKPKEM